MYIETKNEQMVGTSYFQTCIQISFSWNEETYSWHSFFDIRRRSGLC